MSEAKKGLSTLEWCLVALIVVQVVLCLRYGTSWMHGGEDAAAPVQELTQIPRPDFESLDPLTAADLEAKRVDLQRAVDLGVTSARQWDELASAYLAFGFVDAAEACFREGLARNPGSFDLHYHLGFCLDNMGRTDEAILAYEAAARVGNERQRVEARYHVGQNHLQAERPAEAEAAFRNENSHYIGVFHQLAHVLLRQGRPEEARQILNRGFPPATNIMLLQAQIEEALGNTAVAAQLLRQVEFAGDFLPLDGRMAEFFEGTRDSYGAWRRFQVAMRDSQNPAKLADSILLMEKALASEWHAAPALQLGVMYYHAKEYRKLEALLLDAEKKWGDEPQRAQLLGDAYKELGELDKARAAWEKSVGTVPRALVHAKLAQLLAETDPAAAQKHERDYRYRTGVESYRARDFERARAAGHAALQFDADHADSWFLIGEAETALGNLEAAQTAYKNCYAKDPEHPRVHSRLR